MAGIEVAIVGAGPFGLSLAAHLRSRGVPFRIFGQPMQSWKDMPRGMFLKSFGFATSIDVPEPGLDFPSWLRVRGREDFEPCATEDFAAYGEDIASRLGNVERVLANNVSQNPDDTFSLRLSSGETAQAGIVVMAVGLGPFQRIPKELRGLPSSLVSHTFGHGDFAKWIGKDVAVIGAGQSALEAAVLMHEQGVRSKVIVRGPGPLWHDRFDPQRGLSEKLRAPLSVLGPGLKNWLMEVLPYVLYYAQDGWRARLARNWLGPAGTWWLRPRFEGKVPLSTRTSIVSAAEESGRVALTLREEGKGERTELYDHVLAGTGFEHDLSRLPILDKALASRVDLIETAPRLSRSFESSVRGLYFAGPIAAYSFGPLFRFVAGTEYTGPKLAKAIAARVRAMPAPSSGPAIAV